MSQETEGSFDQVEYDLQTLQANLRQIRYLEEQNKAILARLAGENLSGLIDSALFEANGSDPDPTEAASQG